MLLLDAGYLAYQCLGSPEYFFDPWACTDVLMAQGAILCIDSSQSLRREAYPWYKTNRDNVSPTFDAMRSEAHQWRIDAVKRYGDQCRAIDGLEADDVIALYVSPGDTIMGEDKDFLQFEGIRLIDINGEEWADRRLAKFSKQDITQGERFMAWQLAVGDMTDSIPRLLYSKDRTTLKTILKHKHPLWLLLQMVNQEQAIEHLNCLVLPTPLYGGVDTLKLVSERYAYETLG